MLRRENAELRRANEILKAAGEPWRESVGSGPLLKGVSRKAVGWGWQM